MIKRVVNQSCTSELSLYIYCLSCVLLGISPKLGIEEATGRIDYYGARDLGFYFLGSGGEPTKVVVIDQKCEEQKPEDEPGAVRRGG